MFPGEFPPGVTIGRYVSVGPGVRVFRRNHPMDRLSMHPYFYNSALGLVEQDTIESRPLTIGHEAWIGENAIITPGCERIGIGAVVGAGAVVTKDVEDFSIVAGNPAKVIRTRFDKRTIDRLLDSRWWERSGGELAELTDELTRPLDEACLRGIGAPPATEAEVAKCA
jgi:acetyltransferase-like isoleucine patch superfamily enzyme